MPVVSSVGPHYGEESVLVGSGGSGTIFFAGCSLGCIFCQNFDISHGRSGTQVTVEQLVRAMLDLQRYGCSNINFVTPTHVIAPIAAAIESARSKGLQVPTVYNTGGYDSAETLRLLEGLIDIYMPDMKYSDSGAAKELSAAANYPEVNQAAIKEMHRQVGDLQLEKGLAFEIIDFLAEKISVNTMVNVMDQYRPCYKASEHAKINRRPTDKEFETAQGYAVKKGLRVIR
jgi:putative pyruvate formate lyase activating enzyme